MVAVDRWATHRYLRTYEVASALDSLPGMAYSQSLVTEEFGDRDGITDYVQHWSRETAVHKLARLVADHIFYSETSGPYVPDYASGIVDGQWQRYMTVDLCILNYGIAIDPFRVPMSDGTWHSTAPNSRTWVESNVVADACFEYFTESLVDSAEYHELLNRMSEEVFHICFMNRGLLQRLHSMLASYVLELGTYGNEDFDDSQASSIFTRKGKVRRKSPPRWARSAIFYRDRGKCCHCGVDLSGLIDSLPVMHFDHMVPLAKGGLNDLSNLQLLCAGCNGSKSDNEVPVSDRYRTWY